MQCWRLRQAKLMRSIFPDPFFDRVMSRSVSWLGMTRRNSRGLSRDKAFNDNERTSLRRAWINECFKKHVWYLTSWWKPASLRDKRWQCHRVHINVQRCNRGEELPSSCNHYVWFQSLTRYQVLKRLKVTENFANISLSIPSTVGFLDTFELLILGASTGSTSFVVDDKMVRANCFACAAL